jgi:Transglutaminase-like superfamily
MKKFKTLLAFVTLSSAIFLLRHSEGTTLEYEMAGCAVIFFWFLMGLKIAFDNIRTVVLITLGFATIIIISKLFFPNAFGNKHESIMGILPGLDLNPASIGLVKSSNKKALEVKLEREPTERERYLEIGSLNDTEDGLHYVSSPKKIDPTKLPHSIEWASSNLVGGNLRKDSEILKAFFEKNFGYTLSPGEITSPTPLDSFLFSTKKGFCEHFAAAASTLLRLKNYRCRIIYGYAGGIWSPFFKTLTYYNSDAHVWIEVYDKEQKRFTLLDPTLWVFPDATKTSEELEGNDSINIQWIIIPSIVIICIIGIYFSKKSRKEERLLVKVAKLEKKNNIYDRGKGLILSERVERLITLDNMLKDELERELLTYTASFKS